MAKFWEHLKKHEDTIEKHSITNEELQFLKKLQHEMNTQDTVGQADPRYWVIRSYEKEYGEELLNPDGISVYDSEGCNVILEAEYQYLGIDKMTEEILKALETDGYFLDESEIEYIKSAYDMSSLVEALRDIDTYDITVMQYKEVSKDSGMFLTHEAAIEHLKQNEHHYSEDAHTYAMTAWRSKEEPLWDILQKVDFDALMKRLGMEV